MAFEGLSEKLQKTFSSLKGKGSLSEADIDAAMREVKLALLEADVNYKVVKEFVANVKEKALGEEVMKSLTPGQQVIKIVDRELTETLGGGSSKLTFSPRGFTIYMMVGLQGTGKTTTCGKLALWLKSKKGKKPMLCACDVYRPAAIDQLEVVGKSVDVPVFSKRGEMNPSKIAKEAVEKAEIAGYDVLIVDTAGRLQIDEELMDELGVLKKDIRPHEILLVVDALTGQDAVKAASGFDDKLGIDGVIMTKLDSDARGGVALSTKKVTGKPIKFIGVGEKAEDLEEFHPERLASRILGMGDIKSLIDKAEEAFDEEQAEKLERKLKKNQFTLDDFLDQMGQIEKMGGLGKLVGMLPGMGGAKVSEEDLSRGEKEFKEMEAIIQSMTKQERQDPSILNASRRRRIAAGSGKPVSKINSTVKKYNEAKKMMKRFSKPGAKLPGMFNNF